MARRKTTSKKLREMTLDEAWPEVDETLLDEDTRKLYLARKRAVDAYLAGEASLDAIERDTGIAPSNTIRMANRCVQLHKDGRIWGYRALIKHQHVKQYRRNLPINDIPFESTDKSGRAGAFMQLLESYPALQTFIDGHFLKRNVRKNRIIYDNKITTDQLHTSFLDACREQGIHESEYPLSQHDQGLRSLYEYVKQLKHSHMLEYVRAHASSDAARLLEGTGQGPSPLRPERPYQTVEIDGHRIDMNLTVVINDPFGSKVVPIKRGWLLAVIDLYSGAILGYHLTLNSEYNRYDVLRCVLNALTPPPDAPQVIEGLTTPPHGRVPNDIHPELYWTSWDETKLDNALAHRASLPTRVFTGVVGSSIRRSGPRLPFKRPFIERFFGLLEEHTFHHLPGTTGSNPNDLRGEGGEAFSRKYQISLEEIHQMLDYAIAEYNHAKRGPLHGHTPMEAISNYLVRNPDALLRKIPPDLQNAGSIISDRVEVTIKGNVLEGRRPYVNYAYEKYTNDILARSPEMIGEKLIITPNPDDLRVIPAYFPTGAEFGYLTAHGGWGRVPHTMEMRKAIHKLMRKKLIFIAEDQDPVRVFLDHLQKKASYSRGAASMWAQAAKVSPKSAQPREATVKSKSQKSFLRKRTLKTIQ